MVKVYIVHGYTASPKQNWFPWLISELQKLGIQSECLEMPSPLNPSPSDWLCYLEKKVKLDDKTILIGHSLGCIAILNYLAKNFLKPACGIFVSGFYKPLITIPELTEFSDFYLKQPPLMEFQSYVVSAVNDEIVPHHYSDELALHLNANYIRLHTGGHFLDREGFTKFPLILDLIKKIMDSL